MNEELPNVNANIKRKLVGRWQKSDVNETETVETGGGLGAFPPLQ